MNSYPLSTSQSFLLPQPFILIEGEIKPADSIQQAVHQILLEIGEDPTREGLLHTPERVARMLEELTSGYRVDPDQLLNGALFEAESADMTIIRDIEFFSLCEHHLLPFFGKVHIAYLPHRKAIDPSTVARIVEMFARRLQVQERLTAQIADLLEEKLQPQGIAVVVEGLHSCAPMHGAKQSQATMITSAMRGLFKLNTELRREFYAQLGCCRHAE